MQQEQNHSSSEPVVSPTQGDQPASTPVSKTAFTKKPFDISELYTPVAVIIAGCIVAGAILYTNHSQLNNLAQGVQGAQDAQNAQAAVNVDIKDVNTKNEPFIGKADAPVTIAYWSDYQCPYCQRFDQATLPDVIKNYINTGKVKLVFKDFQFLGADSTTAALAARAVWEQYPAQYFTWREALVNKQDAENGGFGDKASIIELTKTIKGIDAAKISSLMESNKATYQKLVDADKTEGTKMGVRGTPGFIIGKQLIPGVIEYPALAGLIDAELK